MPELVIVGEQRRIEVGAFCLEFSWLEDRWVHSIRNVRNTRPPGSGLAVTHDRIGPVDDPAKVISPAYQDIHFKEMSDRVQALLVGQSGPHHFSAVFEVEERTRPNPPGWPYADPARDAWLRVDVADRCRVPIEVLSATYAVDATSNQLLDGSPTAIHWDLGLHRLSFETEPAGSTRVAWSEAGRVLTMVQAVAQVDPRAATHRLQYSWHWEPDVRW